MLITREDIRNPLDMMMTIAISLAITAVKSTVAHTHSISDPLPALNHAVAILLPPLTLKD